MFVFFLASFAADPPPFKVGQPTPGVDALFADGSPYDPADVKGKFVLMTWWTADDEATRKHFLKMRGLRKEFATEKRLQMISIQHGGEWSDWLKFQDKQPPLDPKYPLHSFYSDSKWWQAFHDTSNVYRRNPFRVGKSPKSFLIAPDGKLAAVDVPDAKLRDVVKEALAKK